jgi:hypothetical protein
MGGAVPGQVKGQGRKHFFFGKKKQKTFAPLRLRAGMVFVMRIAQRWLPYWSRGRACGCKNSVLVL